MYEEQKFILCWTKFLFFVHTYLQIAGMYTSIVLCSHLDKQNVFQRGLLFSCNSNLNFSNLFKFSWNERVSQLIKIKILLC